jgi:hypothetical protein
MHFHAYNLKSGDDGHRLELVKRLSTDTEGIATCLGLQSEAKVELEVILRSIENKITSRTLFDLGQAPPPVAVDPEE